MLDEPLRELLVLAAGQNAPSTATEWLRRTLGADEDSLGLAFSSVGRRFRLPAPKLAEAQSAELIRRGVPGPDVWTAADFARAALVSAAITRAPADRHVPFLHALFQRGDNAERQAVLRSLVLLPRPERFLDIAIEACRSSVQSVFDAIACENRYPAAFFPPPNFNQMVLKALFTSTALRRIFGLADRCSPELARMAAAYASERRAAGRPIPDDIGLVTGLAGRGSA